MRARATQPTFEELTAPLSDGQWRLLAAIAAEERLGASAVAALAGELDAPEVAVARDWLESLAGSALLARAGRVRSVALGRPGEEPAFALPGEWRQLVLRESHRRGELERVAASLAALLGERSIAKRAYFLQTGRVVEPARTRGRPLPLGTRPEDDDPSRELRETVASPFDAAWFERTFGDSAALVAVRVLREALPRLDDCGGLYEWARQHASGAASLDADTASVLCQQALLREDLVTADRAASFLAAGTRLGFNAVARYQEGDLPAARRLLDQALAFGSGKGAASLTRCGALSPVLALLLSTGGEEAASGIAQRLLSPKVGGTELGGARRSFRTLQRYATEPEAQRKRLDAYQIPASASAWEVLLLGLTVHLHVQQDLTRAAWAKLLDERGARFLERGYAFPGRQASFLAEVLGGPALERRPGEPRLVDLMAPKPEWQRRLERLALASEASDEPERGLRVAWFVDMVNVSLSRPALQEHTRESGWSAGHRLSLAELQGFLAELPPEDVRVLNCTKEVEDHVREFLPEAWEALIGHPRVLNGARGGRSIEVVRGECRVVTRDEPDFLEIAVEPEGLRLGVNAVAEHEARLVVYRVTAPVQRVLDVLPRTIRIPRTEERRALDVLAKLSGVLRVESPHLGAARDVDADSTPCLRITCRAGAWLVESGVRPFGKGGRFFLAGLGTRAISHVAEGRTLRSTRDFDKERARLSLLITECPSLLEGAFDDEEARGPGESLQTWTFDYAGLLGLLAELRDAGVSCELEWGDTSPVRVRGHLALGNLHGTLRSVKGWYLLRGEVRLDEVTAVSLAELVSLPTLSNGRFIQLPNGDFIEVERRARRVMAALATAEQTSGARELRLHESAFAAIQRLAGSEMGFEADAATRARLENVDRARSRNFDVPADFRAELRPYQLDGFRWLCALAGLGLGACLADDMGLGKTIQILALLLTRSGPSLVVAPTSVTANWMAESARFAPSLTVREYGGSAADRARLVDFSTGNGARNELVICSYGQLQQDADVLSAVAWDTVVLDEAQFIKNPVSLRAQAAFRLRAGQRIAATGTPVENHLGDLWSIFHFLNPALFGSWKNFDLCFAKPIERDADRDREEALRTLVRPFVLRRLKSEVLAELPAVTSVRHEVRFDPDEALRYGLLRRQIHEKLRTASGKRQNKLEILAEITRLRRFCCHQRLVFPDAERQSPKIRALLELAEELRENGHRALVFSQFVDFLDLVREELEERGIRYEYLDGSTPKAERRQRVEAFQQGSAPLFLISLKAGGFGLNLTAADYVIHLDPWWNPAVEAQATDRAHRIGQERPVTVFRLITKDSIEEQIVELHARKQRLADHLLEGGEAAARLDTDELYALIEESAR